MDLVELFERGGPLMWVILGASGVGAAVFLERLWAFRPSRVLPQATLDALTRHLEAGDFTRASQLCREQPSALARIAEAGLRHRQAGRAAMKEAMEERGQVEVGRLTPGLGIIATVAAIAPLLGLLGTVTGMIQVFRDVAGVEHPDVALLAGGIWQALITTGAGLSIAIPFFIAARYLEGRVDRYAGELEEASLSLLDGAALLPGGDRAAPLPARPPAPTPPAAGGDPGPNPPPGSRTDGREARRHAGGRGDERLGAEAWPSHVERPSARLAAPLDAAQGVDPEPSPGVGGGAGPSTSSPQADDTAPAEAP